MDASGRRDVFFLPAWDLIPCIEQCGFWVMVDAGRTGEKDGDHEGIFLAKNEPMGYEASWFYRERLSLRAALFDNSQFPLPSLF